MIKLILLLIIFVVAIISCSKMASQPPQISGAGNCNPLFSDKKVTYDNYVKKIIATYCTISCHTGDASSPGDFQTYKGLEPYLNQFYFRVIQDRADMPQGNAPLPKAIRDSLDIWIKNCSPEN